MADRLVAEEHPEQETVTRRKEEMNEAWERLKSLTIKRQERSVLDLFIGLRMSEMWRGEWGWWGL